MMTSGLTVYCNKCGTPCDLLMTTLAMYIVGGIPLRVCATCDDELRKTGLTR